MSSIQSLIASVKRRLDVYKEWKEERDETRKSRLYSTLVSGLYSSIPFMMDISREKKAKLESEYLLMFEDVLKCEKIVPRSRLEVIEEDETPEGG